MVYGERENTVFEHLSEIKKVYGYRNYREQDSEKLVDELLDKSLENNDSIKLIRLVISRLKEMNVILPGITVIEGVVLELLNKSEKLIIEMVMKSLTKTQKEKLDLLLDSSISLEKTKLTWLRESSGHFSPKAFLEIIEKLEFLRDLDIKIDTKNLSSNRIKQYAGLGSKYEPFYLRRFNSEKRYTILALYLYELNQALVDKAIDIHDKQITNLLAKGRKKQDELHKKNGKLLNEKVIHYVDLMNALIKAKEENLDPFKSMESVMSWNTIKESVKEASQLTRPVNYDYLDLLESRYNQLRKYTPSLIKSIKFNSNSQTSELLVEGLEILDKMNEAKKRKLPEDCPTDFLPKRWKKYLYNDKDNSINRHYYEIAIFTELKNRIRAGDVSVEGSKNYRNFEKYLVSEEDWEIIKTTDIKLAVNLDVQSYLSERVYSLNKRLDWLSKNIVKLKDISIQSSRIHLSRLEKETPEDAIILNQKLYKMIPKIKLPDLLLEVCKWTDFDKNFVHASTGKAIKEEDKRILIAALMAIGTNIGTGKMADSLSTISYKQLANAAQWRLYDDSLKKAQATLVNYQNKLFLSDFWGDGTTSSSDGMRIQVSVSSIHADSNPHYGMKKGATLYRFLNDQYSAFYTKIISTNARDAVHVIDGLLDHETDLNIEEHYTDTAGYTDQVFGLTHLLGFRFAPRIRDISELRLYHFDKDEKNSNINDILKHRVNTKLIEENYDSVLRLAHSIKEGKVTGSLIMGKLGSYARKNSIATALREMGRIEKTIFILDYVSNKSLRRRIQRGLNKGEAMNSLARAIFFGKRGEFREKELQDQLQRASCLNILINAIIVWNTTYLEKALKHLKEKEEVDESLLKHVSPLGWEHINLLGEYHFSSISNLESDELRPLNLTNEE